MSATLRNGNCATVTAVLAYSMRGEGHEAPFVVALCCMGFASDARSDSPGPDRSPWQAYPPSCLAYPLPAPSGPTWTRQVELETTSANDIHEVIDVVFWRTP